MLVQINFYSNKEVLCTLGWSDNELEVRVKKYGWAGRVESFEIAAETHRSHFEAQHRRRPARTGTLEDTNMGTSPQSVHRKQRRRRRRRNGAGFGSNRTSAQTFRVVRPKTPHPRPPVFGWAHTWPPKPRDVKNHGAACGIGPCHDTLYKWLSLLQCTDVHGPKPVKIYKLW